MPEPMPLPDLDYATIGVPATADFCAIMQGIEADGVTPATRVASVAGCEPRPDALGNMQSVTRIDPDGQGGYTLTYPASANPVAVQAVIDAATPA